MAHAGRLRKVWEVDLGKAISAKDGIAEFPVFALRFSPDGRKLAVIGDVYQTGKERKSRLLVMDVDHPSASVRQFEVGFGIVEGEGGRGLQLNFGWSTSGAAIYAAGRVIHLASGTTCELPHERGVFIGDDVAISMWSGPPPVYSSTQVTFFNQDCEERAMWDVPENWRITDVSLDRGLLSVVRQATTNPPRSESVIVDPLARKVLQRWPYIAGGVWEFADSGKVVCQGGNLLQVRAAAGCRNVDTGNEIGGTLKTNWVEPIATAARATRIIFSDYRPWIIQFTDGLNATFKGRVVWDFETGKELVSWRPESETYTNVFKPTEKITEPFRFAMSPDGQYIAEGGNGSSVFTGLNPDLRRSPSASHNPRILIMEGAQNFRLHVAHGFDRVILRLVHVFV